MQIVAWLRKLTGIPTSSAQPMPEGTYCIVQTENSDAVGAVLCHSREAREQFLVGLASAQASGRCGHDGALSISIVDQLGPAASSVWASVQAGSLVQIVGDPLQGGTREFIQVGREFIGTIRNVGAKDIVAQAHFKYASCAPIIAPAVAFQVIHVLAGVQQMRSIDRRLAHLQRIMEEMIFRQQAAVSGRLLAAIECLNDLEDEYIAIGHFSNDMTTRLIFAERDVRTVVAEQQAVIQRFSMNSQVLLSATKGSKSLVEADQFLHENGDSYLRDAAISVSAARAEFMVSRAWIAHDLEHVPEYVDKRTVRANQALDACSQAVHNLDAVDRLREHAAECVEKMGSIRKLMYRKVVARTLDYHGHRAEPDVVEDALTPSCLVWKNPNGSISAVSMGISDVEQTTEQIG